jgi:lipopolysaccharide heptosyltransferase II
VSVQRILVLRYSALGDVVLATSVLDPLRGAFPGAAIEWVTAPHYAPLLEGLPQLAAVHRLPKGTSAAVTLRRELSGKFDLAIDLQNKVRSAFVARGAAERRVAFRRRTTGEALKAAFGGNDPPIVRAHQTVLYAEALASLGVTGPGRTHVHLSDAARAEAAKALGRVRRPVVAVAPGATWATKRWSPARFAEVADRLAGDGAAIALAGGPADREALAAVRGAMRAPIAADLSSLSVEGLAAALAAVDLLVSCDSGPVHLAAAVDTPVLALFGPTSHVRWGPPAPGRVLRTAPPCSPCSNHGAASCPQGHHRCLESLEALTVLGAARDLLAAPPPGGPR